MQELKATQAREVDKTTITEAETLVVNNEMVHKTDAPMQAGDFYFRPNVIATTGAAPAGFFKRLIWMLQGRPVTRTERIVYTVVISCPFCGLPIMTGLSHHITSKHPLAIAEPIACPYSAQDAAKAHAFRIEDGNIIAA